MNSLGRQVLVASLTALAALGGLCLLIAFELEAWQRSSGSIMRDYERAIHDGTVHGGLTRATGEMASFVLTGRQDYLGEAEEAIEQATSALASSRGLLERQEPAADRAVDLELLRRQQSLLDAARELHQRVSSRAAGAGEAALLERVFAREQEADALWTELGALHLDKQSANLRTLQRHNRRAQELLLGGLAVVLVGAGFIVAYVRRRIVAPLTELAGVTRQVAAGNLRPRVAEAQSDEIGQLQHSFNRMMEDLGKQRDQLDTLIGSLAASRDAAREASRAKSDFLANVSHEIRTPMNGVLVSLGLLHETATTTEQRDLTEMARDSAGRLLALLNDLLSFSRSESGSLELQSIDFEPRSLFGSVVALHGQPARARGVAVTCRVEDGVPQALSGDPTRLGQVVLNLLDNAVKHTERGSIDVVVSVDGAVPADGPADAAAPVLLRVRVTDSGVGIPPEAASEIFQPFFQVPGSAGRTREGIGLGLSIAQKLAHTMGGDIGFDSEPGRGASFWFTARLARATPGESTQDARPKPAPALLRRYPGKSVLLVEDDEVTREVMSRTLQRRGLRVSAAENGLEALVLTRAGWFDLILMDCRMDGMDGFEAARAIRAAGGAHARVPIVALTAYGLATTRQAFIDSGFDDVIVKPYTLDDIEAVLARWLEPERPQRAAGAGH